MYSILSLLCNYAQFENRRDVYDYRFLLHTTGEEVRGTRRVGIMAVNSFTFPCAVRGFHVYQRICQPSVNDGLDCEWELGNNYDRFAIKCCDNDNRIVGHLPMEISHITKFLIDRGAVVYATITNIRYRASPLVQGELEVACLVTITTGASFNDDTIRRYKELLHQVYEEPEEPTYIGTVGVGTDQPSGSRGGTSKPTPTNRTSSKKGP